MNFSRAQKATYLLFFLPLMATATAGDGVGGRDRCSLNDLAGFFPSIVVFRQKSTRYLPCSYVLTENNEEEEEQNP